MQLLEWNATVVGGVLCLLYGWFLSYVSRTPGVKPNKIGLIVGIIGATVLTGMAIANPVRISDVEDAMRTYTTSGSTTTIVEKIGVRDAFNQRRGELLSAAKSAIEEIGPPPSKNHMIYKGPTGKLAWITAPEKIRILRERRHLLNKGE